MQMNKENFISKTIFQITFFVSIYFWLVLQLMIVSIADYFHYLSIDHPVYKMPKQHSKTLLI